MIDFQYVPDPDRDLVLDRSVAASPARVWAAWTRPEQLMVWFTPRPWTTSACDIDLQPGGRFRFVNRSPDGDEHEYVAAYLAVVPERLLVWSTAVAPGFRPAPPPVGPVPAFTAAIVLAPSGAGTAYRVIVMHADRAGAARHDELGFAMGWGAAYDQLAAHLRG